MKIIIDNMLMGPYHKVVTIETTASLLPDVIEEVEDAVRAIGYHFTGHFDIVEE